MVTRKDVARLAGTSPAVVSYVLNGGPRNVAAATRARVVAAIEELDYRPNAVARSLRMRRTMTLCLVVPDNSNPFFAELARAIEDAAYAKGYLLLLGNAMDDQEREFSYIKAFVDRQVDGVLVIPSHAGSAPWQDLLVARPTPCVVVDRRIESTSAGFVLVDNFAGAHLVTTHLLEHGRRAIACIAGPAEQSSTADRVAGWRHALAGHGGGARERDLAYVPFGRRAGYLAALSILGDRRDVDGLFVTSDEQAMGALAAAAELGIQVPDDVAIVSFDGISESSYAIPALTTAQQPFQQLGEVAVSQLINLIENGPTGNGAGGQTVTTLPVSMTVRRSCGCPYQPEPHRP